MFNNDIKIAAIQETKLGKKSRTPNFGQQFSFVRQDRPEKEGGGLALIIHESILYKDITIRGTNDGTMESQVIKIEFDNTNLHVANVYIPPTSSCPNDYTASIKSLLNLENAVILGDLNAHDEMWHP